ncbi:Proteasome assembly chaperone 2, partial [Stegodyphus mimosarum]
MEFIYWDRNGPHCFDDYSLILPSVAVGNVGQLAVDLLLNNLKVEHLGYIHHPSILPIAGADPFDPGRKKLATSCELYECKEKKLVIIQQRSPIIRSKVCEYQAFLTAFIKEHKFKKTVLLSSSFSQFFTVDDLRGIPMHYLCSVNIEDEEIFKDLSWKIFSLPKNVNSVETSKIPGGGIANTLLDESRQENIPLIVLILVCSEGYNYPEAFQMISNLNNWLHLKEADHTNDMWKMPISWALPYGSNAPHTIY